MDIKEFIEHYEKLNDKETNKFWTFWDEYTDLEYNPWKHKINFLDKFIKVFKDMAFWTLFVDENIWFINNWEDFYINEEFLDFCIEKKLYKDKAYNFYYKNLDNNMEKTWDDLETYQETYEKTKYKF